MTTTHDYCEGCEGSSGFPPATSKGFCVMCAEAARAANRINDVGTVDEVLDLIRKTCANAEGNDILLPSPKTLHHQLVTKLWLRRHYCSDPSTCYVCCLGSTFSDECGTDLKHMDAGQREWHEVEDEMILVDCEGFHTAFYRAAFKAATKGM